MAEERTEEERRGPLRWLAEGLASRTGAEVVNEERLALLEAESADRRVLRKELDLIAYTALDYTGGSEQDLKAVARRKLVQQARVAWQQDPQLGAATDLMNDFALGRGVPMPKARDPKVQDILDEAWEDEDNQLILTSYDAQMRLGTDLTLQSNLFILDFEEGDDGKVKLGMVDHDTVENVVRDPENRRRVVYYVTRKKMIKWDFKTDSPQAVLDRRADGADRTIYYQHWLNEPSQGNKPPADKLGKGRIYHVAVNRTGEMAFGHPVMHRMLRWANAFNSLMEARVDAAKAAAAFMMKRKVKGTPNQIRKLANQVLSRSGELGRAMDDPEALAGGGQPPLLGPRGGSILTENEGVEHESFKIDSGAQNANMDGQMLRSQISAASHFPQHYLGDIGSANLATATSMELPVLKAVESRQEVFEQLFRWFFDRVIDRAIEAGRLDENLDDEEWAEKQKAQEGEGTDEAPPEPSASQETGLEGQPTPKDLGPGADEEDVEKAEEEERKRDLSYDFGLPSPLRRMLADLTNAVSTIARTFDPNGTNLELSRTLLAIALGEGLEMSDPGEVVDKVFPPGYKDPAMQALEQQQQPPPGIQLQPNSNGAQGPQGEQNPYGAPMQATPADATALQQSRLQAAGGVLLDGNGEPRARTREEALKELEEQQLAQRLHDEGRRELEEQSRRSAAAFDEATGPIHNLLR